jgi:hypothetical protein
VVATFFGRRRTLFTQPRLPSPTIDMPPAKQAKLNATAVSNDMVDNSQPTQHLCHRCVMFYADGSYRWMGRVGCYMPDMTRDKRDMYAAWTVKTDDGAIVQYARCFRCWNSGQECCAVSIWPLDGPGGPFWAIIPLTAT